MQTENQFVSSFNLIPDTIAAIHETYRQEQIQYCQRWLIQDYHRQQLKAAVMDLAPFGQLTLSDVHKIVTRASQGAR